MNKEIMQKIYADAYINIYAKASMNEIGKEADIAGARIDAALFFADQFAGHLKAPKDFLLDFKNDLKNKLSQLTR